MATDANPKLNAKILANPEALSLTLGALVEQDPQYERHRRGIIRLQQQLRDRVNDEAWNLYLRLEELSAARLAVATELAVRWAFKQGRRR